MEAVDNPELRARLDELEQELEASHSHPVACLDGPAPALRQLLTSLQDGDITQKG